MADDPERARTLQGFREAQRVKEKSDAELKRRFRIPPVVGATVLAVLAIGGIIAFFGIPIYLSFQIVDPAKSFCRLVQAHDDQGAYALFSSAFHDKVSLTQFSSDVDGKILDCATASGVYDVGPRRKIDMTFIFANAGTENPETKANGSLSFVNDNGTWKIGSLQSSELNMP